jgi:glucose/arabinose dehydrogenase
LLGGFVAPVIGSTAAHADTPFVAQVNFQKSTSIVPNGYIKDSGAAWADGSSCAANGDHGWVQSGTLTGVSETSNAKARNRVLDLRLDTLMIVKSTAPALPPQWIMCVPNGTYDVTVSVGDYLLAGASYVSVNGVQAISNFKSTTSQLFYRKTVQVTVSNGFIVLDANAGAGKSANSRWNYVDIQQEVSPPPHTFDTILPSQATVPPADPGQGVPVNASVTLSTSDTVDATTIGNDSIELYDVTNGNPVPGFFNTDAAGGVINFTPSTNLAPFTVYEFETNLNLKGLDGVPFAELTIWFQTAGAGPPPPATFNKVTFDSLQGPTALQFGPDNRLYVATAIGEIRRYDIDNTTGCAQNVPPTCGLPLGSPLVVDTYLNTSTITGLAFSDSGDPNAPNVWVSRGALCDQCDISQTGAISELSGANLDTARDVIVGLPRSYHDHMNNGIHFGPDGKLYIAQGAMTGYGAPDAYWGNRSETALSASILTADVLNDPAFQGPTPVDVDTNHGYDPTQPGAPLTVCAQGLRNPFDFVFDSNGHMYSAVNESAGGNSPAGPGNNPPALTDLPPGPDYLDDVVCSPNSFYGHPNPAQGNYTLMGGNPDGGNEVWTWPQYPVGTQPQADWIRPIYDIGDHRSPDGMAVYKSNANLFNGKLEGDLLVTDFSVGKDLQALKLDSTGTVVVNATQIATGFNNPIGVATEPAHGRIYVAEFGTQPYGSPGGQITMLDPTPGQVATPYEYVDFGPEGTAPATSYLRDFGNPYTAGTGSCTTSDSSGCALGWIDQSDSNPLSLVGNGVVRTPPSCTVPDPRLRTYMAMQYNGNPPGGVASPGRWQVQVPAAPSGGYQWYKVTASVGDCSRTDSVDELSVNGQELVHMFQPTGSNHFKSGTVSQVFVPDSGDGTGVLTFDAAGGTNTKINYVNIDLVTVPPPDTTPPVVTLTPSGTLNVDGTCYVGSVTVSVSATDPDNPPSQLQLSAAVDGGPFNPYAGPITISGDGTHTVAANAVDPSANFGSNSASYCIDSVVPTISFSTPDDFLGNGPRLAFSTAQGFDSYRPARPAFLNNPSPKDIQVTNLSFSGTDAGSFAVTSAPTLPFTIPAGQQQEVDIEFHPSELNPSDTTIEQYASFDVTTNNPVTPTFSMPVAGADAVGFEGGNEPNANDITRVLGFTTSIPNSPGTTRLPASADEVISPYWVASDSSQPVDIHPLSHYATRYNTPIFFTGWDTKAAPKTINQLYTFPQSNDPYGGANQQIEPAYTGTTTFSPGTTPFGLATLYAFSDDFYNSSLRLHNMRFFVARDPHGNPIPHEWIVLVDIGTDLSSKNYDYQDEVMLIRNADPLLPGAPAPSDPSLNISFCNTYPSSPVLDANGNGTGFTTVMPNTAGNQYDPSKITLDNPNCALHLLSTKGTMTAKANTQIDALADNFDATRGTFTVTARLQAPFTQIDDGHDHQAVFWGADQNDFMKLEVENNGTPAAPNPNLVAFFEQTSAKGGIPNKIVGGPIDTSPSLGTLTSTDYVDLSIKCDPAAGSCTFWYSVDGAAATQMMTSGSPTTVKPTFPLAFFNRDAYAGVLDSNQPNGKILPVPFTGTYNSFSVTAP